MAVMQLSVENSTDQPSYSFVETMKELTERLLSTTQKTLFKSKPVYESRGAASDKELSSVESEHNVRFPTDLRYWLLEAGFGEFRDEILIDPCWFNVVEEGDAKGHFIFAQDGLGNFYSFPAGGDSIFFLSRRTSEWTEVAKSFQQFLEELEARDFEVCNWSMTLNLQPCDVERRTSSSGRNQPPRQ